MTTRYSQVIEELQANPKRWLISGVAGFIGSNLLEKLLLLNQKVVGLDNFATGHASNFEDVKQGVTESQWRNFEFIEGDIKDFSICQRAVLDIDFVLHQAALGSVPRSIENPLATNAANVTGFLNILEASRLQGVKSFTYAASSSTYGDSAALPKVESVIGNPLSPYAVTKYVNELYAGVFSRTYGLRTAGLRYFNVFGRRQDPNGPYAAVIPRWVAAMISDEDVFINGDGATSRDFCFVENVVQMNILAATSLESQGHNAVFNVAVGDQTSLNELFQMICEVLSGHGVEYTKVPIHLNFREGDVRHSKACIEKAKRDLHYRPQYTWIDGLNETMPWYVELFQKGNENKHI